MEESEGEGWDFVSLQHHHAAPLSRAPARPSEGLERSTAQGMLTVVACSSTSPPLLASASYVHPQCSGRVYYYHKATCQSTFEFPTADSVGHDDDDDDDDDEPPPAPASLMSRTIAMFHRRKETEAKGKAAKGKAASNPEAKVDEKRATDGAQKTVFISCSTLIKEVSGCLPFSPMAGTVCILPVLPAHVLLR